MWMMGCSDGGGYNMPDPYNGPRKYHPLLPKPSSNTSNHGFGGATSTTHSCFNGIHRTDLFLLNRHLEQNRREYNSQTVISSRWNPTPEQLQTLEELYRCGTRTPSAEQIQHITAQLRRYGKIEGKNVFYWFQNHKARERQKRRRQTEHQDHNLDPKESDVEVEEEAKSWGLSSNLTTLTDQSTVSIRRTATTEESRTDGWTQLEETEFQQRRRSLQKFATWQNMHLTYSPPITLSAPTTTTTTAMTTTTATATTTVDQKLRNNLNLHIPNREFLHREVEQHGESQTLELFPLGQDKSSCDDAKKESEERPTCSTLDTSCSSYQFYKFL